MTRDDPMDRDGWINEPKDRPANGGSYPEYGDMEDERQHGDGDPDYCNWDESKTGNGGGMHIEFRKTAFLCVPGVDDLRSAVIAAQLFWR